jgi:hypothetical protein
MADQEKSNINHNYTAATVGLNMDQVSSQVDKGQLTYALNAAIENYDDNSVNYQNEPGNELCITFPEGFVLIGTHFIVEQDKHMFFITNPITEESQIGYMENNDCIYHTLVDAACLNFNINHPIHKIVHRITNCDTQIYWTDGFNPRRYLSLDAENIPREVKYGTPLCDPAYTDVLDCNQLNVQPDFNIPFLNVIDVRSTGDLKAGAYQFAIQYADALGNPLTSYYSVTNPVPIADNTITTVNYDYPVGKSIVVDVTNLEVSGLYRYYNIAVIKTINNISSVELIGTYSIEDTHSQIVYTGQSVTDIRLSTQDIFEKYPYYEIAQDITTARDILIWDQLSSIDRINYQQIANKINLQWETWRIPATENYANEINATNYRGYLRDEVYAFEIVFLLANGKQTDGFHIPGRERNLSEQLWADVPDTNDDFIGTPDYYEGDVGYSPYWKIYNTATIEGFSPSYDASDPTYKGAYQNGEFGYWESTEEYPCNKEIWGELAGQKIRHHKFPDVEISPIFESKVFVDRYSMVMGNDAIFPIGVKVNPQQIKFFIDSSDLTKEEKDQIIGFKIVRGDRSTNKSIVAKGMLRNVNKYERDDTEYYFPNYPYNDLREDPFINLTNNAYADECESFKVSISKLVYDASLEKEVAKIQYIDCNTNRTKVQVVDVTGDINICAIGKPFVTFGKGTVSYMNYDVWGISWGPETGSSFCGGYRVEYNDITEGITRKWVNGSPVPDTFDVKVVIGSVPTCVEYCDRGFFCGDVHVIWFKERVISEEACSLGTAFESLPLPAVTDRHRQIFNSPETSFGQPFLGDILKLESVMFGKGKAHFTEVKKNAKYKLISKEAQKKALDSSAELGFITDDFSTEAMFAAYQSYLTIYLNNITRKNYAYSFNSIASYDYCTSVPNGLGIKQRNLDIARYLISTVLSVGDDNNINNYNRESSVYLRTDIDKPALPFADSSPNMLQGEASILTERSRFTVSEAGQCNSPGAEQDIEVVSYYASIKKNFVNQWGQIYSYDTIDTGFQHKFDTSSDSFTVFGGDTYINRFAFKTKLPFFIDNRVGAPDDSDIFYDEIGNVGYPKYWHSSRSIFDDYTIVNPGNANDSPGTLVNIISYKAHNFDCPNDTSIVATGNISGSTTTTTTVQPDGGIVSDGDSERTFYDGLFYLFAYGIPNFYCESSYNVDLRQAFNNREGDFWPHVSTSIPDEWVQESFVSIANDNTYYYNSTFSKQNKENFFSHLPADWDGDMCMTHYPFRAIYSDPEDNNADNRVNTWRIYRAISYHDFPQNYGQLTSLDGIQNRAILARFENKTLLYDNLITIDTSNPQAAYIGNPSLFKGGPPIDFADTDLGYMGSQHKFMLKIPHGQITIDAKRGHVFLIQGTQATDISRFGSGMNRFLTDHLPFEILKTFPDIDIDNHFKGLGLHGVYDSKFERVIITKLDYVPLSDDIIYDDETKEFYYEHPELGRQLINLTDDDYFCNKSWTLSYNMNTQKWISFHTYLPNWYIGENNFYYSGLNDCCGDFEFVAGAMPSEFDCLLWGYVLGEGAEIDCEIEAECTDCTSDFTTTTTSTSSTSTSTTTSTTTLYGPCDLEGEVIEIVDEITTTTTSTTICVRPSDLETLVFITGFTNAGTGVTVDSTVNEIVACDVMHFLQDTPDPDITPTYIFVETYGVYIGSYIYVVNGTDDCECIPDGWYFTDETSTLGYVFHVEGCVITEIYSCDVTTSTSTTSTSTTEYPYDCELDGEVVETHTTTTTSTTEEPTTTTTTTTCYLEVILVSPTTTTTSTTECPIDADLIEVDCEEPTTTTTTSSSTTTTSSSTTTTTTVEPTTTTTTTTEEPLSRRMLMYVGPDAPDLSTETIIPYQEDVEIALNTPTLADVNFFFISIPFDMSFTIYDMLMADVSSEFEYHSDQIEPGYVNNTIYRKRDIYDTTGSTNFFITITNI